MPWTNARPLDLIKYCTLFSRASFISKSVEVNGNNIIYNIWDTAGQEKVCIIIEWIDDITDSQLMFIILPYHSPHCPPPPLPPPVYTMSCVYNIFILLSFAHYMDLSSLSFIAALVSFSIAQCCPCTTEGRRLLSSYTTLRKEIAMTRWSIG